MECKIRRAVERSRTFVPLGGRQLETPTLHSHLVSVRALRYASSSRNKQMNLQ